MYLKKGEEVWSKESGRKFIALNGYRNLFQFPNEYILQDESGEVITVKSDNNNFTTKRYEIPKLLNEDIQELKKKLEIIEINNELFNRVVSSLFKKELSEIADKL